MAWGKRARERTGARQGGGEPSASMEAPTRLALPWGSPPSCILRLHIPRAAKGGIGEDEGGKASRWKKSAGGSGNASDVSSHALQATEYKHELQDVVLVQAWPRTSLRTHILEKGSQLGNN